MTSRSTLDDPAVPVTAFIEIDAARDRLEAGCRDGRHPDLAAYLDGVPDEAREPLLRVLLKWYRGRFPEVADVVDSLFRSLTDPPKANDLRMQAPDSEPVRAADPEGETRTVTGRGGRQWTRGLARDGSGRVQAEEKSSWPDMRSPPPARPGRHGCRLQGAADRLNRMVALKMILAAASPRRPRSSGSAWRPRRSPTLTTRTSSRSMRWASTGGTGSSA